MASKDKITSFLAERRNMIVAGIGHDGRPHLSPNWFYWDGERFFVSTTRHRVKYRVFKQDSRAQLAIDDSTSFRCVLVSATAEIHEDLTPELARFRAIREKHGVPVPGDEEHLARLTEEGRVLLVFTPDGPPERWAAWGLD
ncbi:MAG: pyridoxamine 5'-phosphate oxidase family protein [Acidimicrobiales bacterium]